MDAKFHKQIYLNRINFDFQQKIMRKYSKNILHPNQELVHWQHWLQLSNTQ